MCRPISIIMSADSVFTPTKETWEHSHTAIAKLHGLADGQIGDKYARVEVIPPHENEFRDKATNLVLVPDQTWTVLLDENREPAWWSDDKPAQIDRAIQAAKKWLASFPENLVPGAIVTAGDGSKIEAGYDSEIKAGDGSKIEAGYDSEIEAGDDSKIKAGYGSKIKAGDRSEIEAGDRSEIEAGYDSEIEAGDGSKIEAGYDSEIKAGNDSEIKAGNRSEIEAGDGSIISWNVWDIKAERYRLHVYYVGEGDIKPNTKYRFEDGKPVEVK